MKNFRRRMGLWSYAQKEMEQWSVVAPALPATPKLAEGGGPSVICRMEWWSNSNTRSPYCLCGAIC